MPTPPARPAALEAGAAPEAFSYLSRQMQCLRNLAQSAKLLKDAAEARNAASMAYASAANASLKTQHRLRDKLDIACSHYDFAEHEAHCAAVDAEIAQPEPARYGAPIYSRTAAGDQYFHGVRRAPASYKPSLAATVPARVALPLVTDGGWSVACADTAQRSELLAYAADCGLKEGPGNSYAPHFLHIGWYKGLATYPGPEENIVSVADFRVMCGAHAASQPNP